MNKLILLFFLVSSAAYGQSISVRNWWMSCKGSDPESTCLTDSELSKFKSICSSKSNKEDCRKVVDYTVAKIRIAEGKAFLLSGYVSQLTNFAINKKYLNESDKIWQEGSLEKGFSFAVGVLPSCNSPTHKKLVFGRNLRSELKDFRNQFIEIYESLASIPCPDSKSGFVLVTIGKVFDSHNEFEVFTVDEKKNFKIIHSAVGAGPFISKNN